MGRENTKSVTKKFDHLLVVIKKLPFLSQMFDSSGQNTKLMNPDKTNYIEKCQTYLRNVFH